MYTCEVPVVFLEKPFPFFFILQVRFDKFINFILYFFKIGQLFNKDNISQERLQVLLLGFKLCRFYSLAENLYFFDLMEND